MFTPTLESLRSARVLAICGTSLILSAARPAFGTAAAGKDEPSCRPILRIVKSKSSAKGVAPVAKSVVPPEVFTTARAVIAPPLDELVARIGHVRSGELIRSPHLDVIVDDPAKLTPVSPESFTPALWNEMIEILSHGGRGLFRNEALKAYVRHVYSQCSFVTLRARINPSFDPVPLAGLTLGPYHYSLQLRSRVRPAPSSNQSELMDLGTYRSTRSLRQFKSGPEFHKPIPGGLTNRGFFKGRIVGAVEGGQIEPMITVPDQSARLISGTWHFENDWLILRLYMSMARFEPAP